MRETILEYPEITLYFHPDQGIVHHDNHNAARGESFRAVLSRGAELMETRGATKWLSNDHGYFVLPPDDERWGVDVWFPRVKAAGWKYWAVVKPATAVAELNVSRFVRLYAELGITVRLVSDFDEAWSWLVGVDE